MTLAILSGLFLLMASVTGMILALGASYNDFRKEYDLNQIKLDQTIHLFQKTYAEVYEFQIDDNYFFKASVVDKNGESLNGYFNPATAEFQGKTKDMPTWYLSTLNFHRSLFLKSTGRIIMGVSSFLLGLMALSGLGLLIARQGNLRAAFSSIVKLDRESFYHIILGRWTLIPILIIALSGVFLSLFRFDQLKSKTDQGGMNNQKNFSELNLADLNQLDFPFSSDPEDFYYLETKTFNAGIHQYDLIFKDFVQKDFYQSNYDLISDLHTGRGLGIYALILFLAAVNMIYFLYSGSVIFLRRSKKRKTKKVELIKSSSGESFDFLILYGSESGSTESLSYRIARALNKEDKRVKVCALNDYEPRFKADKTLILTATYGEGEPPFNADEFFECLQEDSNYFSGHELALLGFGSSQYKHFCGFAKALSPLLESNNRFFIPPRFIDNFNFQTLSQWLIELNTACGTDIDIKRSELLGSRKVMNFELLERYDQSIEDSDLFNLRIKVPKMAKFESGDLMAVQLEGDQERLYSMSKIDKEVLLSVKRVSSGLGSGFLAGLNPGDQFKGHILKNDHFHLPKGDAPILLIANGTGIAPFIGMIKKAVKKRPIYLYFGLRYQQDFDLYKQWIPVDDLTHFELVLSKEKQMTYVQEVLLERPRVLQEIFDQKGSIMVCGAKAMENDLRASDQAVIQKFIQANRFQSDCY